MAGRTDRGGSWAAAGEAWAVIGTLAAGIVTWGAIGYLVDRLAGFRWLFLPIGMVIGVAAAIYLVYVRYGRDDHDRPT
ncbi:MAG: AtpZ/AtpI family protein [Actinobacteria bacterium]|nr:AtpZ/AtpI family protein [Actinomycetota bacterium]